MPNPVVPVPRPEAAKGAPKILNYSLRPAKNIERKMMGEAFARLSALHPLSGYRYVGFGSEFFNDFSLYHQTLGVKDMVSIERDVNRFKRCEFNRPYRSIKLIQGDASDVLPKLTWNKPSIVWLDYTSKLDRTIIADAKLLVSQISSSSLVVWSVNAHPWGGDEDEETGEAVKQSEWPARRLVKLQALFGNTRRFDDVNGSELAQWGLAKLFHNVLTDEVRRALNDRNASAEAEDRLTFKQCFHFRYADGQRMLTVGGVFLNRADAAEFGADPFDGLTFIRTGEESVEIDPPTLTGREIRHLSRLLPNETRGSLKADWLSPEELERFRELYRYYPVFAESEL